MRKYLVLLLASFLLFSCASRKVLVTTTEVEAYTDSVVIEQKDSVSVQQNAIIIIDSSEEVEITPIDTAKPIVIGEVKYFNAKIKIKKTRRHLVDSSKVFTIKSVNKQVAVQKDIKSKVFEKKVDKKANYFVYLWLLLIPIGWWFVTRFILK